MTAPAKSEEEETVRARSTLLPLLAVTRPMIAMYRAALKVKRPLFPTAHFPFLSCSQARTPVSHRAAEVLGAATCQLGWWRFQHQLEWRQCAMWPKLLLGKEQKAEKSRSSQVLEEGALKDKLQKLHEALWLAGWTRSLVLPKQGSRRRLIWLLVEEHFFKCGKISCWEKSF